MWCFLETKRRCVIELDALQYQMKEKHGFDNLICSGKDVT